MFSRVQENRSIAGWRISLLSSLRLSCLLLSGLFLGTLLTSVATAATTKQETTDMFSLSLWQMPQSLDPVYATTWSEVYLTDVLFEGLVNIDKNKQVTPATAHKWDVMDDGKRYRFHLRNDAFWTNGDQVTAHDFVLAFQRVLQPGLDDAPRPSYLLDLLVNVDDVVSGELPPSALGIKAVDDLTLDISLEFPASYFLVVLAYGGLAPIPSRLYQQNQEAWDEQMPLVTNGPYTLEATGNDYFLMKRNEKYFNAEKIDIQQIKMQAYDNQDAAMRAILKNEVDFVDGVKRDQLSWIEETFGDRSMISKDTGTIYGIFNTRDSKLTDPAIRCALALAIDRKFLAKRLNIGEDNIARTFAPSTVWSEYPDYVPQWENNSHKENLAKARSILNQHGYTESNPLKIHISYIASHGMKQAGQAIRSMWSQLDVEATTIEFERGKEYSQTLKDNDYEFGIGAWYADYTDPMTFYSILRSTSSKNHSDWVNPEFDDYMDQALVARSVEDRNAIYMSLEDMINQDCQITPLFHPERITVLSDRLLTKLKSGHWDYAKTNSIWHVSID